MKKLTVVIFTENVMNFKTWNYGQNLKKYI